MVDDVLIRVLLLHAIVGVQLPLRIDHAALWIRLALLWKLLLIGRLKESLSIKVSVVLITGCVWAGIVRQCCSTTLLLFLIFLELLQKVADLLQIALPVANRR